MEREFEDTCPKCGANWVILEQTIADKGEKAQEIANKCKYRGKPCRLCWERAVPSVCCAYCTEFGTTNCDAPPCKLLVKEVK